MCLQLKCLAKNNLEISNQFLTFLNSMYINSYDFGRINIDGKEYTNDLIIHASGEIENWWREESHDLTAVEAEALLKNLSEMIIIGIGYSGLMKVSMEARDRLNLSGAEVIIEDTRKAVDDYNKSSSEGKKAAAALHLTC